MKVEINTPLFVLKSNLKNTVRVIGFCKQHDFFKSFVLD